MLPIRAMEAGETVKIIKISGKDETKRHLNELGISEGDRATVVQNNNGNLILHVKGGRIAIDEKLAMRIKVDPERREE